jgi:hypothetical protein
MSWMAFFVTKWRLVPLALGGVRRGQIKVTVSGDIFPDSVSTIKVHDQGKHSKV